MSNTWQIRGYVIQRVLEKEVSFFRVFSKMKNGKPVDFQFEAKGLPMLYKTLRFFEEVIETPAYVHKDYLDNSDSAWGVDDIRPNPEYPEEENERPNRE